VAELAGTTTEQDTAAVAEMVRITKPRGKIIVTVPFGKSVDYGGFVQYDIANIDRVFNAVS